MAIGELGAWVSLTTANALVPMGDQPMGHSDQPYEHGPSRPRQVRRAAHSSEGLRRGCPVPVNTPLRSYPSTPPRRESMAILHVAAASTLPRKEAMLSFPRV